MKTKIQIESGVPIPEKRAGLWSLADQMREMKVGDSFVMPPDYKSNSANSVGSSIGIKVTTRKLPEGTRVWRIE